jgi:hypothetical protein
MRAPVTSARPDARHTLLAVSRRVGVGHASTACSQLATATTRDRPSRRGNDAGQITAFVVVMMAALILLVGLVLDGGLTLAAREHTLGEAQEAARAGAQAINLAAYRQNGTLVVDPTRATTAAQQYLADTGDSGTVQVSGNIVTVTVGHVQRMQILDVAGLSAVTVHATASAEPERGITAVIP